MPQEESRPVEDSEERLKKATLKYDDRSTHFLLLVGLQCVSRNWELKFIPVQNVKENIFLFPPLMQFLEA